MDNNTFTVIRLMQNLTNSLRGSKNIYDPDYVEDVKKRIPNIEKAFEELKKHFQAK